MMKRLLLFLGIFFLVIGCDASYRYDDEIKRKVHRSSAELFTWHYFHGGGGHSCELSYPDPPSVIITTEKWDQHINKKTKSITEIWSDIKHRKWYYYR